MIAEGHKFSSCVSQLLCEPRMFQTGVAEIGYNTSKGHANLTQI